MNETFLAIATMAHKKVKILERSVFSYLMLAFFGGLFIGFGMLTFIVIGGMLTPAEVPYTKIVQATVFGIALCMVMLGGVDLFTGNNLVLPLGALEKRISWFSVMKVWSVSYGGNFVGAYVCAWLLVMTGYVVGDLAMYVEKVTVLKTSASFSELLFRGIYCNLLVCLAVWCTYRVKSEGAKIALIFCCIFPFILGGFEHSIANMMLFSVTALIPQGAAFTMGDFVHNLIPVTIGNIVGGALLAVGLWLTETGNRIERS